MSLDIRDYKRFLHCHRYHAGLSKAEHLARMQSSCSWFYNKKPHIHHRSTYGMKGHFGGWCGFAGKSQRHRMVRLWRKQARRANKQWIKEQEQGAEHVLL